jgi:lactose/L-arabinose transport system substrate-binding protein
MKKFISALMAGTMAVSLAACSSGSASASTTAASSASSTDAVEISVAAWDKNFNIPALKAAEADYQKNVNPNFKLNIIEESQSSDVENAITLAASSGDYSTLPDIVLFQDHYIQKFVSDYPDAWQDLEDSGANWSDLGKEKLSFSTINGKHYGMPVDNGTAVFAYRTDLLQECGYTIKDVTGISWDKWIEIGKTVYEKTGKYLMSMDGTGNDLPYMMLQAEGVSQFKDGQPYITDNETMLKVIDVIKRAVDAHALYLANDWSDYTDQTIQGDMVAGVMNGNWIIPTIEKVTANSGKWELTTLPTLAGGKEGYASNGGSSLYVTGKSKNAAVAKDFLAKTFGAGSTATYDAALKNGGVIGCSTTAGKSDVYQAGVAYFNNQAIYAKIVEWGASVKVVEQSDYHYTCRTQIATAIQNIISGADEKSALKDAEDQLKFAMQQ